MAKKLSIGDRVTCKFQVPYYGNTGRPEAEHYWFQPDEQATILALEVPKVVIKHGPEYDNRDVFVLCQVYTPDGKQDRIGLNYVNIVPVPDSKALPSLGEFRFRARDEDGNLPRVHHGALQRPSAMLYHRFYEFFGRKMQDYFEPIFGLDTIKFDDEITHSHGNQTIESVVRGMAGTSGIELLNTLVGFYKHI